MATRTSDFGIGASPPRPDGLAKATGAAIFADDERVENLWYGATVRSTVARAAIRAVRWDAGRGGAGAGVVLAREPPREKVVTARDLPGPNGIPFVDDAWPILAGATIEHVGEPIALVAARTPDEARSARDAVEVIADPLEPVLSLEAAAGMPPLHQIAFERGDVEAALRGAAVVVEGTYRTGHQEHLYIECQAMTARWNDGAVTVAGTMQCPYYVHRALCHAFGLSGSRVRVRATAVGGGFGGKEDYPSVIAVHAALAARAAGAPVRLVYDRHEDIVATSKRHPSMVRHRTAVGDDGRLLAMDIDVVLDGGAYLTLSSVVLSRALLHATGPYRCPAVRVRGVVRRTNTAPNGAFRGFGAPQVAFAVERQMDRIARVLGLDPYAIRARNVLVAGDRLPTGQRLGAVAAGECLEAVTARTRFVERWTENEAAATREGDGQPRRGLGLSLCFHGAGFTGNGERMMRSPVTARLTEDGRIEVETVATDMGQGAAIVLPQMAADGGGVRLEDIVMTPPDTAVAADSGPTVASRTTMIVGSIARDAVAELSAQVLDWWRKTHDAGARLVRNGVVISDAAADAPFADVARRYRSEVGPLEVTRRNEPPTWRTFDEATFTGVAYGDYSWGADVVEVETDPDTFETRVVNVVSACEIGTPIHRRLAIGQIEGGTLQAIGFGLMEEMKVETGRYVNDRLSTYLIPTIQDAPSIESLLIEPLEIDGRVLPKGAGELPMDGGGPALAAALENATGRLISALPATAERVMASPPVTGLSSAPVVTRGTR
jgi:CO/xanthine dehydrogenase Mo-binding subunit